MLLADRIFENWLARLRIEGEIAGIPSIVLLPSTRLEPCSEALTGELGVTNNKKAKKIEKYFLRTNQVQFREMVTNGNVFLGSRMRNGDLVSFNNIGLLKKILKVFFGRDPRMSLGSCVFTSIEVRLIVPAELAGRFLNDLMV